MLAFGSNKSSSSGSSKTGSDNLPSGSAVEVTAEALYRDYHANEVAADDKYKEKRLKISGKIEAIEKDAFDNIVVRLETGQMFQSVHATLQASEKSAAAKLEKGKSIALECKGEGMIIGSPKVASCLVR